MTERKQALQELLDKVAEGEVHGRCLPAQVAFGPLAKLAWAAQDGSLDAAKALHEAVLPGWLARPECGGAGAGVKFWGCTLEDWDTGARHDVHNMECPARAWLIAIIKALIAKEAGQ